MIYMERLGFRLAQAHDGETTGAAPASPVSHLKKPATYETFETAPTQAGVGAHDRPGWFSESCQVASFTKEKSP